MILFSLSFSSHLVLVLVFNLPLFPFFLLSFPPGVVRLNGKQMIKSLFNSFRIALLQSFTIEEKEEEKEMQEPNGQDDQNKSEQGVHPLLKRIWCKVDQRKKEDQTFL